MKIKGEFLFDDDRCVIDIQDDQYNNGHKITCEVPFYGANWQVKGLVNNSPQNRRKSKHRRNVL